MIKIIILAALILPLLHAHNNLFLPGDAFFSFPLKQQKTNVTKNTATFPTIDFPTLSWLVATLVSEH